MSSYRASRFVVLGFALATVVSLSTSAQSGRKDESPIHEHGLRVGLAVQKDCPLKLLESTHGVEDLLLKAVLKNVGHETVASYRIGWVILFEDTSRKPKSVVGKVMNTPSGVEPGAATTAVAQGAWA